MCTTLDIAKQYGGRNIHSPRFQTVKYAWHYTASLSLSLNKTKLNDFHDHFHSIYSYHKRGVQQLLSLTDSFTWEELPTRDPDTGHLTKAGYIQTIQRLTKYSAAFVTSFYFIQSAVRIVSNHELIYTSWFPFDISATPVFVFANLTQVQSTVLTY